LCLSEIKLARTDATRRTRQRGQDIPAGSNRSPFHNIRSATAIAARLADPECSSPKAADEDVSVDGVAATNNLLRRYFPTIGLGELERNPFSRWVRSHSRPQDLAAIVLQNQQPIRRSE
jgi:hypothetical protein